MFEEFRDERQAQINAQRNITRSLQALAHEVYDSNKAFKKGERSFETTKHEMTAARMLILLYRDVYGDICGNSRPFSSLFYLGITVQMLMFFNDLCSEL